MGYNKNNNINKEKDAIQFSFVDSYFNLTLSTVLIYYWTKEINKNFDIILKVDSDVYPNIKLIALYININKNRDKIIYGYYYPQFRTNRNKSNSNYIPYDIYSSDIIPGFVAGSFYIFPKINMWHGFVNSMNILSNNLIYREDIQLGLFLNYNNVNIERINKYYRRKKKFKRCKDIEIYLAVHGVNINNIIYIYSHCINH